MATQPSEEDINNFAAFSGADIPRAEVIARLQGNNNNLEQAIGEYFDNPSSEKYTYRWDESAFGSDRDSGQGNHGVSFDIQSPDVTGPSAYNHYDSNGLASRPPSRTSHNKSPLGKIVDLNAEHAAADPQNSMSFGQHEDSDLEQAIAASRAELGMPPQESGVTNTNEVHFGPATRDQYESGRWEMVPLGNTSVQEMLIDPEPAKRKRDLDVPAFLKPSVENHRLGALLTIYHEIPLIREIFLPRAGQDQAPNYGYDKEWWSGKAIDIPVVFESDGPPLREVNLELQRLMAFLDKTDRSYGSIEALANLRDVKKELRKSSMLEAAVLNAWKEGFSGDQRAKLSKLFSRGAGSEAEEENNPMEFGILELALPEKDSIQDTLYDIADEVLWPGLAPLTFESSPYLCHVADVIAFQIEGDETKKNVEIPAVWYPDRYMKSSRQASLDMRLRKSEVQEGLQQIINLQESLTNYTWQNKKTMKVKDLFEIALQHDHDGDHNPPDPKYDNEYPIAQESAKKTTHLSAQLRSLVANIDKKLSALNEEKEKSVEALRKLSTLYTNPSSEVDPAAPKFHRYTLRGVSTTKSTFYVCRRAEPDLIDIDLDRDGPKSKSDQWWRIHFAISGSDPVNVEKTTEEKVLEAAKSESKNIVLVYSSEKAMDFEIKALPTSLENFTRMDNRAFKAELIEADESQTQLSSPGKRKWEEQSESSPGAASARRDSGASPRLSELAGEGGASNHHGSIGHKDQMSTEDTASQLRNGPKHEVIVGVNPKDVMTSGGSSVQEMQERSSMRMMASITKGNEEKSGTIDNMDLDEVTEDDKTAGESAAVKHVGYWAD